MNERSRTRPWRERLVDLVNTLLPADMAYFQIDFASGRLHGAGDWPARFGCESFSTMGAWLGSMPADDRERIRRDLRRLAAGDCAGCEAPYRTAGPRGVAVDMEITVGREASSDGGVTLHAVQRRRTPAGDDAGQRHALANDLAGIVGYAELLDRSRLDAGQRSYLEEIVRSARQATQRLGGTGGGLPEVAQRLGRTLQGSPVPPSGLVDGESLLDILQPIDRRRRRHGGAATEFSLAWRENRPAAQFLCSACGSPARGQAIISMGDDGAAIPRSQLAGFFQPGFDAVSIAPGEDGVAGAMERLHALGGHVVLQSDCRATAIHIVLPASEASHTDDAHGHGERILVVDDDASVARYLATVLRGAGYVVVIATGPAEALAVCGEAAPPFDAVVSDASMPGIPAASMLSEIESRMPGIAVVICTGHATMDDRDEDWQLLSKPVEPQRLIDVVRFGLERGRNP